MPGVCRLHSKTPRGFLQFTIFLFHMTWATNVWFLLPCAMGLLHSGSGTGKLMRCADEYRSPCRVNIGSINNFSNTDVRDKMDSELCLCPKDRRCLNHWSTADGVQSVTLRSESRVPGAATQYNMMFCHKRRNRIVPRCKRNDTTLQIAGFHDIPTNFVFYKCRCRAGTPLVLTDRERTANNLVYEKYTCANFLPKCQHRQTCASHSQNQTKYHCKCANQCLVASGSGHSACH